MNRARELNEKRYPRSLRFPNNGIPGYDDLVLDDQLYSFSALIRKCGGRNVRRLWPKLDFWSRWNVMSALGCFAGPEAPQQHSRPRFERELALAQELRRQIKSLEEYLGDYQRSLERIEALRFKVSAHKKLNLDLVTALKELRKASGVASQLIGKRHDWDAKSMIKAQEYIKRRTEYFGAKLALTPAVISEILDLNECGSDEASRGNTLATVRKALVRFRSRERHRSYLDNIGRLVGEWQLPMRVPKKGH